MKPLFVAMMFTMCATFVFSQANMQGRPSLGIWPFSGIDEAIGGELAHLLSNEPAFWEIFYVPARDRGQIELLFLEHDFQLEDITDPYSMARIGEILNANHVLFGDVRRLGDINLVIATIVNVQTLEQVTGYYRIYQNVGDIIDFFPSMAQSMVQQWRERDGVERESLAITSFAHHPGVSPDDAYTLTQILAIEIIRRGTFAVLSRTSALEAAMTELDFQMDEYSITTDEGMSRMGLASNADYVLDSRILQIADRNIFFAGRLSLGDGIVIPGHRIDYQHITDGITDRITGNRGMGMGLMAELAAHLHPADVHIFQGEMHLENNRYNQAIAFFQAALQIVPNHIRATELLGIARARQTVVTRREEVERDRLARDLAAEQARLVLEAMAEQARLALEAEAERDRLAREAAYRDRRAREEHFRLRLWSVGASVGTSFRTAPLSIAEPLLIGTVQATLAPFRRSFFRIGCDFGFISGVEGVDYFSMHPFIHYAFFMPFRNLGGLYIGAGGGFLMEEYRMDGGLTVSRGWPPGSGSGIITLDFTSGLIMRNRVHISYTMRTNVFDVPNIVRNADLLYHKISVGWIFRFPHSIYRQRSR